MPECAAHLRQLSELREWSEESAGGWRSPSACKLQLQVLASRERARWNATKTVPLAFHTWAVNIKLAIDNLMRPLAVPLAGGLVSALLLFSLLVPTLGFGPVSLTMYPPGFIRRPLWWRPLRWAH
jgi:hypothetical protein